MNVFLWNRFVSHLDWSPRQRASQADAIHLTLRFLGEVPAPQVAALLAAFGAAIRGLPAPAMALGGVGAFPDLRRPRVLWAGLVTPGTALADLQRLPLVDAVTASAAVESVAVKPDGPDAEAPAYLNAVALVTTRLAPSVLLAFLHGAPRGRLTTRAAGVGRCSVSCKDRSECNCRCASRWLILCPF